MDNFLNCPHEAYSSAFALQVQIPKGYAMTSIKLLCSQLCFTPAKNLAHWLIGKVTVANACFMLISSHAVVKLPFRRGTAKSQEELFV